MKVYLNKYRSHWLSPYKICKWLCFWRKIDYDEPWVKAVNRALEPVCTVVMKFLDLVHPKIDYVKIDYWDVWSMDHTLSPIILPMLKELKRVKHGSGTIALEDVPPELRYTEWTEWSDQQVFPFYETATEKKDCDVHTRYEWFLNELIWTFEQLVDEDWDAQYATGEIDHLWVVHETYENGKPKTYRLEDGPNHTYKMDYEARNAHQARIDNGLRLFGKYYQTLWD